MREQLALVRREQASSPNSCGVSCTSVAVPVDGPLLEVDLELADLEDRLGRGPARRSAARRRASSSSIPNGFVT